MFNVYLNEDQALEYKHSFNAHSDSSAGFFLLAVIHPLHHPEGFISKSFCSFSSFLTIFSFFAMAGRVDAAITSSESDFVSQILENAATMKAARRDYVFL